ncbi:MAG: preprotein translocase subunit SecE [Patescibacteria group bacterium]|jgi:preprotein translocase subunit SecE|nr:preprotein translocase subunit SecE [Patescibacteria group bacterium]HPL01736.1 preprotein translocase subunit SecE [bacterium]
MRNNRAIKYLLDSYEELKKVSWPTRKQLIRDTLIVVVSSAVITAFIAVVDFGLSKVLEFLVSAQG